MISNREIKGQIDELTEQHQFLTQELQQIKDLLKNQDFKHGQNDQQNQNGDQQQDSDAQTKQNNDNNNANQSNDNGNALFQIANDFLKLKGLISNLEKKMKMYSSAQSPNKNLTEEDVVNLMLNMMNGMIDWTVDFVSKQQSNQSSTIQ